MPGAASELAAGSIRERAPATGGLLFLSLSSAVREAVENGGGEAIGNTPQEYAALIRRDEEKYAKLVKISGAKPD